MAPSGLYCTRCGHMNDADAVYCAKCGAPQVASSAGGPGPAAGVAPATVNVITAVPRATGYGGFWIRFLALIIDAVLVRIAVAPFAFFMVGSWAMFGGFPRGGRLYPEDLIPVFAMAGKLIFIQVVVWWLYEALMTSSTKQATVGKMVLALRVTDTNGQQMTFGRASARHFAKYLSGLICFIGYLMAAFTERKQALHDLIAGTYVLKTSL